jgi:hypothetical protein
MLDTEGYKHKHTLVVIFALPLQKWLHERASLLRHTYLACLVPLYLQHVSVATNYRMVDRLYSQINIHYCTAGVPGAKWQPVSPYRFRIVFPPRLRPYFGCVSSIGVWTNGPRDVYGPIGIWEKMIVLESLSSIVSALVGTIAMRNVLILHWKATCLACTLTP